MIKALVTLFWLRRRLRGVGEATWNLPHPMTPDLSGIGELFRKDGR